MTWSRGFFLPISLISRFLKTSRLFVILRLLILFSCEFYKYVQNVLNIDIINSCVTWRSESRKLLTSCRFKNPSSIQAGSWNTIELRNETKLRHNFSASIKIQTWSCCSMLRPQPSASLLASLRLFINCRGPIPSTGFLPLNNWECCSLKECSWEQVMMKTPTKTQVLSVQFIPCVCSYWWPGKPSSWYL